jgi:hypothetical protein
MTIESLEKLMATNPPFAARLREYWCALDGAVMTTWAFLDPQNYWPWEAQHLEIRAAWDGLTRPENLADLEEWLASFDGGASMNHWAREVTLKAIEVSRQRGTDRTLSSSDNPARHDSGRHA